MENTEQQEAAKKAAQQKSDKLRKKKARDLETNEKKDHDREANTISKQDTRYTNRYYVPSSSLVTNNLDLGLKSISIKSIRYVGMFEQNLLLQSKKKFVRRSDLTRRIKENYSRTQVHHSHIRPHYLHNMRPHH